MKTTIQPEENEYRVLLQQLIGHSWTSEIRQLSKYLMPEWVAGYSGLKKLIEKDQHREEDMESMLITNT